METNNGKASNEGSINESNEGTTSNQDAVEKLNLLAILKDQAALIFGMDGKSAVPVNACSGEIVSSSGKIVTANHCLTEADRFIVETADGSLREATVASANALHDVAVLTIIPKPSEFKDLETYLGSSISPASKAGTNAASHLVGFGFPLAKGPVELEGSSQGVIQLGEFADPNKVPKTQDANMIVNKIYVHAEPGTSGTLMVDALSGLAGVIDYSDKTNEAVLIPWADYLAALHVADF
jgi:hypothetical protein